MTIFICIGLFFLIILKYSNLNIYKNKKAFCFIIFIFVFIICAIKSNKYGDIPGYLRHYDQYSLYSYDKLWYMYTKGSLKDFCFYAIAKIFNNIGISKNVWVNLIAGFFTGSVTIRIYKDSKNPLLSLLVVVVFYLRFTMTALRQSMAMACVLFSISYIQNKNLFKFILIVLLGSLFHSSAIVFLPAYWISKLKAGKKQLVIVASGLIISVFFPYVFRRAISLLSWDERLSGYADSTKTLSWAGYVIQLAIFIFCYVFSYSIKNEDIKTKEQYNMYLNLLMVGVFFQGFANSIAEVFRLSYFYSIISCIALPNIIESNNLISNRRFLRNSVFFIFLLYMIVGNLYGGIPFFWEV